jgi:hypothetical protein
MTMRDIYSNIGAVQALAPAVKTAAGDGAAIDLATYGRVAFVVNTGAIAGSGDFAVKVQDSDDGSTFADAPAAAVQTNAPATLAADSAYRLGYLGDKRYVRLALTKAGGTSIAAGAVAILGDPRHVPVA